MTRDPKSWQDWQQNGSYLVAIQLGDVERCAALLAAGADADQTFKTNSMTRPALCLGVERGAFGLVKLLLKSGVSVNRQDSKGYTGLHVACAQGYEAIVSLLLENGADVNAADCQMITPLMLAAKRNFANIVSDLIFYGCDVNKQDEFGKTALGHACSAPNTDKEVVRMLLGNGASSDDIDVSGMTPLMCALLCPNFEYDTVKMLVENGARLDLTTGQGNSPIHIVIFSNNLDKWKCLKFLLKSGCDINMLNHLGQSPVHLACLMSDIESLRILIRANANVNTVDRLGISPLSYCIGNGFSRFAHLLIAGGAKEDLTRLNTKRLKPKFREGLEERLKNPMSLKEISRFSLCAHLGPLSEDWVVQNESEIPRSLIPFVLYNET